jgi:hypothetical protein
MAHVCNKLCEIHAAEFAPPFAHYVMGPEIDYRIWVGWGDRLRYFWELAFGQ